MEIAAKSVGDIFDCDCSRSKLAEYKVQLLTDELHKAKMEIQRLQGKRIDSQKKRKSSKEKPSISLKKGNLSPFKLIKALTVKKNFISCKMIDFDAFNEKEESKLVKPKQIEKELGFYNRTQMTETLKKSVVGVTNDLNSILRHKTVQSKEKTKHQKWKEEQIVWKLLPKLHKAYKLSGVPQSIIYLEEEMH